jgi:hypothetical protein
MTGLRRCRGRGHLPQVPAAVMYRLPRRFIHILRVDLVPRAQRACFKASEWQDS